MNNKVVLCLPGLLPPFLAQAEITELFDVSTNTFPALCTLLSRATMKSGAHSVESLIKSHFSGLGQGSIPSGALSAKAQGLNVQPAQTWCCADPIVSLLDPHTAYLQDNQTLALSAQELHDLNALLAPIFQEDQSQLHIVNSTQWYCQLSQHTQVSMNDLWEIWGKSLAMRMPSGPDENYWRRFMTECQMLLMQSSVNRERERQAKAVINSLWFWGIGQLPTVTAEYQHIDSNDSVITGLAQCAAVSTRLIPQTYTQQAGATLYIDLSWNKIMRLQQVELWYQKLIEFEKSHLQPILQALQTQQLQQVVLQTLDTEYQLSGRQLRYFWRKVKSLPMHLDKKSA